MTHSWEKCQNDGQTERSTTVITAGQRSNKFIYLKIAFHMYSMSGFMVYSNHVGNRCTFWTHFLKKKAFCLLMHLILFISNNIISTIRAVDWVSQLHPAKINLCYLHIPFFLHCIIYFINEMYIGNKLNIIRS